VTHLLHWALHEVVSKEASQKGSFVGTDKLTFDFSSGSLTSNQVRDVEKLVNERILENAVVSWMEVPYADVKKQPSILQFFGEKYGDRVRVVQIGGNPHSFDGYSMELCGGTHVRRTGEIGLFRIIAEGAVAAGIRRIEATAGLPAYQSAVDESHRLKNIAALVGSPLTDLERKLETLLHTQKELEKALRSAQQREAAQTATALLQHVETLGTVPVILSTLADTTGDALQDIADALKSRFHGIVFLAGTSGETVSLLSTVSSDFVGTFAAGKLIQAAAPCVEGKGGGRPDSARGAGRNVAGINTALATVKQLIAKFI
jgi:alanyl-tRNA synthetase